MFQICQLKTEYKVNPIGMDEPKPRFSYRLNGDSAFQKAYRIEVRTAEGEALVWNSGWVEDGRNTQIEYAGEDLQPFTRYHWRVCVKDDAGVESRWSTEAFFETGFMGQKWQAEWISCAWGGNQNPLSRMLRDFELTKPLKKARLYATALGVYDVYLNGECVGKEDCLRPGWTDYYNVLPYQAYDVCKYLKTGANTLAATVADGWYVCKGYGQCPMFLAELHIYYEDGTKEVLTTGDSWKAFYIHIGNPMRMSNLYNGEFYEAWEETDWKMPGGEREYAVKANVAKDHSIAHKTKIVWQNGPSNRRMMRMEPVSIELRENGAYLVDFGQNFTGRECFRLKNTKQGTVIVIKHGEMLNPNGSLYVKNLRNAWQRTIYTTGTHEEEIYEPQYTYYGFRYLEISGWIGELTKEDIWAYAVYSDLEKTGDFECSEPLLNRLYQNIVWGQRSNFLDVPTDCPQRDERQGWTGDTQVFANVATYNMACGDFYTKWLDDLNTCRTDKGAYAFIAPNPWKNWQGDGATGWSDAAIVCPWIMMLKYADVRIVKKYLKNMRAWLDWEVDHANGSFIVNNATFGDWLNQNDDTDREYLSTAYLAGMAALLAKMAELAGEKADAESAAKLAENVRKAFIEKYFDADGVLSEKSQTAAVLALAFRLCPDELAKKKTLEMLVENIRVKSNLHLSTGFLGTPLLLKTLTENGESDLAYDLLLQTTFPGWLYPVTQGATTMWERWNSWTEKDGFADPEMNSFNHYAYGAVGDWFFETICGIRPEEDRACGLGMKDFALAPIFGNRLTYAKASYVSPYGEIKSSWIRNGKDGSVRWDFTVPVNSKARIVLPEGYAAEDCCPDVAGPGSYSVILKKA